MKRTDPPVAEGLLEEEAKLLEACRRGDQEAFKGFVLKYQHQIFSVAFRMLRDQAEAEDVAQEVFLKAFSALGGFRGESKLSTWLYRITSRLCLNRLKARKKDAARLLQDDPVLMENSPTPPDRALEERELRALLERELQGLSEEQRIVLVLRDIQGLSYEEIAFVLGIELGTVRSRLHRARMALKERVEKFL
ncbi:MAG: sigma-70 family RNA polymerase sigma factor [candidate division NC10 bacterium]|nr:sigma-70 family RNA polymerase sigma factor [candidate division NC10 bacterium]